MMDWLKRSADGGLRGREGGEQDSPCRRYRRWRVRGWGILLGILG